jgi:hypothetical protein
VSVETGGRRVAVGTTEGTVQLLDPQGRTLEVFEGHGGKIRGLAFRPDGRQLVSGSRDDTVRLWSLDGSHPPIVLRGHQGTVSKVAYSPRGDWLVSAGFDPAIRFWRVSADAPEAGRQILAQRVAEHLVYSLALGPDGRILATSSAEGLKVFELSEDFPVDRQLRILATDPRPFRCLDIDNAGRRLSAVVGRSTVAVWDLESIREGRIAPRRQLEVGRTRAACGDFDPDGERLVVPSQSGSLWVVDLRSPGDPIELLGHRREVLEARFLDRHRALSLSVDGTLRRWRVDDQDPATTLADRVRFCLEPETRRQLFYEDEGEARERWRRCRRRLTGSGSGR